MLMIKILLGLIVLINLGFVFYFIRDLLRHRSEVMSEPATTWALPFSSFIIFLLSTFGISDLLSVRHFTLRLNGFQLKNCQAP
ncbi:hypothetical protein FAM7821_00350 [Lacticaseibacillus paracasei]|nr:hypothetical protein [Lacticaseibacillus casei]NMN65748.1 hypothetical protein [Lacticaseibacillus casei CRF28]RNE30494.1 hypothetical protein FAM6161_00086 [Lacticaseibacillus paracasei]RNE41041.1 hypothetical protein FAM7821_00350 [Lacticaseibacillus paracasei]GAV17973.1 hypothetical protein SILAB01_01865 [Lacticaseibacillus paracasei]